MSRVTSFVFICVLSVLGVRNCYGSRTKKVQLQNTILATAFTPIDENGNLSIPVIAQMAQYYKSKNITGVYISAYYGGGSNLPLSDKKALVSAWAEQTDELGIDLVVELGTGPFSEILEFAQFCSQYNISALTAFAEVVYQPEDPSEVVEDFQRICDAANNLSVFYHELSVVDQEICPVESFLAVYNRVSCIAGLIASIGSLTRLRASTNKTDYQFWVDTSDQTGPGLLLKVDAAASPANTLCPGLALDIAKAVKANRIRRALKLQQQMNDIVRAICYPNGSVADFTSRTYLENMKYALYSYSDIDAGARYPIETPNSTVIEQIRSTKRNYKCY